MRTVSDPLTTRRPRRGSDRRPCSSATWVGPANLNRPRSDPPWRDRSPEPPWVSRGRSTEV